MEREQARARDETRYRLNDPPPDWWDEPSPPPPRRGRLDFTAFFVLLDAIRRAIPGDLQNQFTAFVREGLLTLRSLIDWYLERLDRPNRGPKVEDIPIE